jgi:hypothetical protein
VGQARSNPREPTSQRQDISWPALGNFGLRHLDPTIETAAILQNTRSEVVELWVIGASLPAPWRPDRASSWGTFIYGLQYIVMHFPFGTKCCKLNKPYGSLLTQYD